MNGSDSIAPGPHEADSSAASAGAPGLTAGAVLRVLRRRWLPAVLLSVFAAAAGGSLVWFVLPLSRLTVFATLHVSALPPTIVAPSAESRIDFNTYRFAQPNLLKSRLVLGAVLAQPHVAGLPILAAQPEPLEWLERHLLTDFKQGPELLRVSLDGDDADQLTAIVNAVTGSYLKEIVNKERSQRLARLEKLKEIQARYEDNLRKKRKTVRDLVESVGSTDTQVVALRQAFAQEELAMSQRELLQLRSERRRLEVEAAGGPGRTTGSKSDTAAVEVPDAVLEAAVAADPTVIQYRDERAGLEKYIEDFGRAAVPGAAAAALDQRKADLARLDEALKRHVTAIRPKLRARLAEQAVIETRHRRSQAAARLAQTRELEQALAAQVEKLTEKARTLNVSQLDLESYKQEIAQAEKTAEQIGGEIEGLRVELDAPPRVTLIDEATVSRADQAARRLKYAGAAVAGGPLLVLMLLCAWELRNRRVYCSAEVVNGLGMNLVGTLPPPPQSIFTSLPGKVRQAEWEAVLTESVDTARTMLLHAARRDRIKVVLVTSALEGEGKTTLACHLAASLARAGCQTLLLDGDLRRPSAHRLLGLADGPGFAEVLRGEGELTDLIVPTVVPGLSFLPAGVWSAGTNWHLARSGCEGVFERLRADFDFLILDSAPVLPIADALLLAGYADAALLSILRDVSRFDLIRETRERLAAVGVRTLGAVLAGVNSNHSYSSYRSKPAESPDTPVESPDTPAATAA